MIHKEKKIQTKCRCSFQGPETEEVHLNLPHARLCNNKKVHMTFLKYNNIFMDYGTELDYIFSIQVRHKSARTKKISIEQETFCITGRNTQNYFLLESSVPTVLLVFLLEYKTSSLPTNFIVKAEKEKKKKNPQYNKKNNILCALLEPHECYKSKFV